MKGPGSERPVSDLADTDDAAFRTSVLEAQAEAVDDGILLVSPSGDILSFNRRFAELWGFSDELLATHSDEAALAQAITRLVDPTAFLERVRYLYEHPEERSLDEIAFRDGRVLERYSAPVRGRDGTHYGRVWSFRDITAQRRIEQSLARRASEQAALYRFTDRLHHAESLEDVYRAAIDAILTALGCDRASLLLFDEHQFMGFVAWHGLSDAYRRAVNGHTPWEPHDAAAQPITVSDIAESDLDAHLRDTVLAEGIRAFAFIPLPGSDRLLGKFMVYYDAPHDFTDEEIQLALTVARQIAFGIERRRAEERRAAAEAALREADRRKDEFLATLAHELRNPLAAIHNAVPLVRRKVEAGEDPEHLFEILGRQTSRLGRLVDDLMDVSRITRGRVELRREHVDLAATVRSAIDTATANESTDGVELSVEVPRSPVPVVGDPIRLEQVVHNLVANAMKYTAHGGRVHVALASDDGTAELRVRDTGIGIAPDFLPYVFDLFRQADRSLDRAQGGLGIGLTVARRLVELHGGSIDARSDGLGHGSEFIVRIPLGGAGPAASSVSDPDGAARSDETRRRVLVVDDNRDQTDVLAELVAHLGHQPFVAHDGEAALEAVREVRPDVVLIDIGLPGMSGYDVARRLRSDRANADLTLVALTGYSQPADRERASDAGFDEYIVKPIEVDALRRLLERRSRPHAAAKR